MKLLESRLSALETLVSQLTIDNANLRQTVTNLQLNLSESEQQGTRTFTSDAGVSAEQQDLNTNIVIRGVEIKGDASESDLRAVYEGIRSHLTISDCTELDPVSVSVLQSNPVKASASFRPIRVQLSTVAAKTKFLQVRRVKKDIVLSDIVINNSSRRPILISEQLTRQNQELLYKARSLRGKDNFKFVWSTNGQILARQRQDSKVIRIIDAEHVNRLRAELNLEPIDHGRLHTTSNGQSASNEASI